MTKIKQNLAIDGNFIISYLTKVAEIHPDKIVELGKFSQTTSRHIQHVADLFKLPVVKATNTPNFIKLAWGAKVI
jgi:hypothetical protein